MAKDDGSDILNILYEQDDDRNKNKDDKSKVKKKPAPKESDNLSDIFETLRKPEEQIPTKQDDRLTELLKGYEREKLRKTRRKSKLDLLIPKKNPLITIDGKLAINYTEVLKALGYKDINLESYHIDKRGYSPEAAKILGEDYLNENIVIITPVQKSAGLVRSNYSFLNKFLDDIFTQLNPLIQDVTSSEGLFGKVENPALEKGIEMFILSYCDNPNLRLKITFETPMKALERIKKIKEYAVEVTKKPDLMFLHEKNFQEAAKLKEVYGDLEIPRIDKNSIETRIDSFKFSKSKLDLYMILEEKAVKPVLVYFNKQDNGVSNGVLEKEYIILNGDNTSELINILYDLNIIDYDTELAKNKMEEIKLKARSNSNDIEQSLSTLTNGDKNLEDVLPPLYSELKEAIEGIKTSQNPGAYFKSLKPEVKLEMYIFRSRPIDTTLIQEILSRTQPSDLLKKYLSNETGFMDDFSKKSETEQIETLKQLTDSMVYENQNNPNVNYWLMSNYKTACDKAEIKFIEA